MATATYEKQSLFEKYHYGVYLLLTAIVGAAITYGATSYKLDQTVTSVESIATKVSKIETDIATARVQQEENSRHFQKLDDIALRQQQNYENLLTRLGQMDGKLDRALNK